MMNKNDFVLMNDIGGFKLTFSNGLTASVIWGTGSYSDNGDRMEDELLKTPELGCNNAEVAVLYQGELIDANQFVPSNLRSGDDVIGYLTSEQVVDFLMAVKNATSIQAKVKLVKRKEVGVKKVVINACFGGFGLSEEACSLLDRPESDYWSFDMRSDPKLIEVVEKLGERASGDGSKLQIVEIPDDVDYTITDYDGIETVEEKHRRWG